MRTIPWIIAGAWAVVIVTWIVTARGVKRDVERVPWWRGWAGRVFGFALLIVVLTRLGVFRRVPSALGAGSLLRNQPIAVLAAILCVCGGVLSIWARVTLGRNWSPIPAMKEEHELVTSGPYNVIRHPIYTGLLVMMLGAVVIGPVWLFVFLFFVVNFVMRVRTEEGLMMQLFPRRYPDYKKRTWALVPFVW